MMLEEAAALLGEVGQPQTLYRWLDEKTKSLVGHKLFTLLYVDGEEVARVYSSQPDSYKLAGRKRMGPTPWGDLVIRKRTPWLGRTMEDIRWAFPDHALIESLGCASCINIPIVYNAATIGTMNILDVANAYDEKSLALVAPYAMLLIPAYLNAARGIGL
ncbi:GAF domain-containing protein [Terrarubrum flagellatum]|uniref:GAF domain-containing protein n=1 Tax=Terrirubrum flagellatum TaxID=2895980 RepID=UPI00314566C2